MVSARLKTISNFQFPISNFQDGFTLLELLIVIALIGVLASALVLAINPNTQLERARDSQRKSDLRNIQTALELYYEDNKSYPTTISFGQPVLPYMAKAPQDPRSPTYTYRYEQELSGQGYQLYAVLERCKSSTSCNDRQACNNGNACSGASGACGSNACTYGVASSNLTP